MSMTKEGMADKIMTELRVLNPGVDDSPIYELYWRAISQGIINEITANMDITTTVTVPNISTGSQTAIGTGVDTSIT